MSETSIASARASVMIYDDINKKWIPSGNSSGLSKVHIFQHTVNNTFRVVGRKLHDQEVVINCVIMRNLKYNLATATFHQWRDQKQVYGLNFSSREDADSFARAMAYAVDALATCVKPQPSLQPPIQQQHSAYHVPTNNVSPMSIVNGNSHPGNNIQLGTANNNAQFTNGVRPSNLQPQQQNGYYEEDMGYRTMTKEDMVVLQERRMSQQPQREINSPGSLSSTCININNGSSPQISQYQQVQPPQYSPSSGHQRTSSAPPAPQPPPTMTAYVPTPPQPPPAPAPPCPPPMPTSDLMKSNDTTEISSLASQLQSARLKRSNKQFATENSGSSTSSGGSSNYGTLGRGQQSGMASMMDEMAKTLARRRAAVEKKDVPMDNTPTQDDGADKKAVTSKQSNLCESPKMSRKLANASSTDEINSPRNGDASSNFNLMAEFENLKLELLSEMRKEVTRAKQEIIDAIKTEFSRR